MHLGCHVPYLSHCDLDLDFWPSFKNYCVWSSSLIFFELGIPNLVCKCILDGNLLCECILEWRIVPFHFPVTVTLTSDLVSRICIKSGAKLLYSLRLEFQIKCVDASWDGRVPHTIFGSL